MNILVLNAGSSTVKLKLFAMKAEEVLFSGSVDGIGEARGLLTVREGTAGRNGWEEPASASDHHEGLQLLLAKLSGPGGAGPDLAGIGHRMVHGGERFRQPCLVDEKILADLQALNRLAPLHNPANLAGIRVMGGLFPGLPQAVCFDTAFHAAQPPEATAIPLPARYREAGIRRYGFHGLSFEHIAAVLPEIAGVRARGRVIVAHLGSGVSLCAMTELRSVATTMGFSTLDGPPMATRCGSIDPGVVLYLLAEEGMDGPVLADLLYHRSGLLGLSGRSGDMKTLLADPSRGSAEAVEIFIYRVAREIGSLAAALEGLDLLVFTGGIGENSAKIRSRLCSRLAWLGVDLDEDANERGARLIAAGGSRTGVCVIPAREELVIARHTHRLLSAAGREEPPSKEEGNHG